MGIPSLNGLKGLLQWGKDALSEQNGTSSFGRTGAAVIIVSTIFWITYLVLKMHGMPDLAGPTLFLTSGVSATYGANKVSAALNGAKDKQHGSDTPDKTA